MRRPRLELVALLRAARAGSFAYKCSNIDSGARRSGREIFLDRVLDLRVELRRAVALRPPRSMRRCAHEVIAQARDRLERAVAARALRPSGSGDASSAVVWSCEAIGQRLDDVRAAAAARFGERRSIASCTAIRSLPSTCSPSIRRRSPSAPSVCACDLRARAAPRSPSLLLTIDENERQLPDAGGVHRFVEIALRSAPSPSTHTAARLAPQLERVCDADRLRRLRRDRHADREVLTRLPGLRVGHAALVAAPVEQDLAHRHAAHEHRAGLTVGWEQHVVARHRRADADGRGFLAELDG